MSEADVRRVLQQVGLLAGEPDQPRRPSPVETARREPSRIRWTCSAPDRPGAGCAGGAPSLALGHVEGHGGGDGGVRRARADMGRAHLVLAGPSVEGVADDPEAAEVLEECLAAWQSAAGCRASRDPSGVPPDDRRRGERGHPQRAATRTPTVVAQKSLAEGFGLTVAEAMWKGRPVVGSAVGGIVDQIVPGETGLLLEDPSDLATFAESAQPAHRRSRRGGPPGPQRQAARRR